MRARWKLASGAGVIGIGVAFLIGHSREVSGDTTDTTSTSSTTTGPLDHESARDPNTPYPLGPGAIAYDQLSAVGKAGVDQIQETVETTQPPSSYQAWAAATAWTGADAERQIAERGVGLVGTQQDGVVP